jgi:hypothetical protein
MDSYPVTLWVGPERVCVALEVGCTHESAITDMQSAVGEDRHQHNVLELSLSRANA